MDAPPLSEAVRSDLRRAALALGVAALDTYLHWAIRNVDLKKPLSRELSGIEIDFGTLVDMGRKSVKARKAGTLDRPMVRARNALNEQLLTMTFQSARQVEKALQMLGVTRCWSKLAPVMNPPTTSADLQKRLNSLSHRRNKIVHEGDLLRLNRPQKVGHEKITAPEVAADLDWIEAFVAALDQVI
ncbi:HEPN domain-containing protein [Streptomyces hydrogenans]|uniref:HEPN domain-containing protein n=1 Tax=Streptomyces hydrogenans TaxID=1873719 RepID=UPI0035DBA6BA